MCVACHISRAKRQSRSFSRSWWDTVPVIWCSKCSRRYNNSPRSRCQSRSKEFCGDSGAGGTTARAPKFRNRVPTSQKDTRRTKPSTACKICPLSCILEGHRSNNSRSLAKRMDKSIYMDLEAHTQYPCLPKLSLQSLCPIGRGHKISANKQRPFESAYICGAASRHLRNALTAPQTKPNR